MQLRAGHKKVIEEKFAGRKWAYTGVIHGNTYILGIAEENVAGYTPLDKLTSFRTYQEAQDEAKALNEERGINGEQAALIVLSSMYPQQQ